MSGFEKHDHLVWREISRTTVLDASIFRVHRATRRADNGAQADYALVDSPDWCNVIAPVTRADGVSCFVMAKQYRQGSGTVTIEFPGGLVDHGEDARHAAFRELEEETGYTAGRLTLIGKVNPNPAFMTNTAYTFYAHDVVLSSEQALDENELLDVVLVPRDEIVRDVRPEFHTHAIMMNALAWLVLYEADGLDYDSRLEAWTSRE